MSTKGKLLACLVGAFVSCLLAVAARSAEETYTLKTIVPIPGGLTSFDIAFVDANVDTFVLADRTNKSIDVTDTSNNRVIHQFEPGFVGATGNNDTSGPNGVLVANGNQLWAGDGPTQG